MKIIVTFLVSILCLVGCEFDDESSERATTIEKIPYKISVSISGLEGSLELNLNGDELLPISESDVSTNAGIGFISRFNSGQSYVVEVSKQPDSQYCSPRYSLGSESGEVDDENITVHFFCQTYFRGLNGVTAVSAGNDHTCAIANNEVKCWGSNALGQLDIPEGISNPIMISSGSSHSCVLEDTGLICWGENNKPALKQPPQNLIGVKELKSGAGFSCVIDDKGLHCWGQSNVVSAEIDLVDPHSLTAEHTDACVIDEGNVKCWGASSSIIPHFEPIASSITIGFDASNCITKLDEVICFEAGGSRIDANSTEIELLASSIIEFSRFGACALTEGSLSCWGSNFHGWRDIQNIVEFPTALSIGLHHGCAIQGTEVICVGSNFNGEIEPPNI